MLPNKFIIESEGDMELGIKTLIELANIEGVKKVFINFPSNFMMEIFVNNMLNAFSNKNVPKPVNIEAVFTITEE